MTLEPTIRAPGPNCHGTGDVVVTLGTHVAGDSLWIVAACDTDTIAAPAGWTKRKTAFLTGIAVSLFSRNTYAASGAEANPTIVDPGNHCIAFSFCGDMDLDIEWAGGCSTQGSTTTARTPSSKTAKDDLTAAMIIGTANSAAPGTGFASSPVNADLAGITEIFDDMCADGNGSGLAMFKATKLAPGDIDQGVVTVTAGNTVGMLVIWKRKPLVPYNRVVDGAPNGVGVVKLVDVTQPDVAFVADVTGGAGATSGLVRYDDHQYIAVYDDGTKRGAGAASVA